MSFQGLPPNMTFYPDQQPLNPYSYAQPVGVGPAPPSTSNSKPHKRLCSIVGCKNGIVQGGVCVSHGAKRRKCRFPGCTKNSKCAGLCSKHGPPRKKCEHENCSNVAVRGGKCKSHGATSKRCEVEGCSKVAAFNNMCKRHRDLAEAAANEGAAHPPAAPSQFYPQSAFPPQMYAASAASQNNSVIAQNNFAAQSKLSQVIAAQNRLGAGMGMSSGFPPPQYPFAFEAGMMHPSYFGGAFGFNGAYPIPPMRSTEEHGHEQAHGNELQDDSRVQQW
ncbi:hypothetical protein HJC23_011700 [Cyclotella cryptica]|uniref:WRKY transcription factor 19 n=1 Tax=Cyclotella cryptica TaxID=29204 RepID=A0ABD3QJ31_9STRA|eukprot:CCRYP_004819-RA/>CCRYP_004819-RA protein AED:0.04 eAED:0.04 QI:144/1/1/1/1/0.66/3/1731/275